MTDTPAPAPTTAPEAAARLSTLSADSAWAGRLLGGDVATRGEFDTLTKMIAAADVTAEAIAGKSSAPEMFETTYDGALSSRAVAEGVQSLREVGLSDDVVRQVLNDAPVTRTEFEAVKRLNAQRMGDQVWISKLLEGDYEARREFTTMQVVLNSAIKDG